LDISSLQLFAYQLGEPVEQCGGVRAALARTCAASRLRASSATWRSCFRVWIR
jgi:hypothetical protein